MIVSLDIDSQNIFQYDVTVTSVNSKLIQLGWFLPEGRSVYGRLRSGTALCAALIRSNHAAFLVKIQFSLNNCII